jgi:hypothetical protein
MKYLLIITLFFAPFVLSAQDDLLNMLDSIAPATAGNVAATFKTTRIVTGHSIESMKEGQLEFRISHRFGRVNSGVDNFFGIDQSTIYLGLEYGVTDWLELGIGRTPNEKIVNSFVKVGLLSQSAGDYSKPVSISYLGAMGVKTGKWDYPTRTDFFSNRLTFAHQLLIAHKFNEELSLQLTPTMIHNNLVPTVLDDHDIYAMGIGGRYKISSRVSVNVEYFYCLRPTWNISNDFTNALSVGFDIETGGHVFQIMLSNSLGMIEKHYISENTGSWTKGDIHIGFNISRVFTMY